MNLLAMSRTLGSPAARRVRHLQRHLAAASLFSFSGPPMKTYSERHSKVMETALSRAAKVSDSIVNEEILLAAGCFWGVELAFARIPGVLKTSVGYCGGRVENPTYEQVCSGSSGHTEAVHLAFDNNIVHLNELLNVFWEIHDPTTLNRQGNDIGTQYRSGIYYNSDAQLDIITRSIAKEQPRWNDPIVTEVKGEASNKYWVAEEYHQGYLARGGQCALKGDKTPIRCYG